MKRAAPCSGPGDARGGRLRAPASTALAVLTLAALAGCGSSSENKAVNTSTSGAAGPSPQTTTSGASTAAREVPISADPSGQLHYTTRSLSVKQGAALLSFTNKAPVQHNLTIESSSGSVLGATPTFSGGTRTLQVTLSPGTYKFYCTVPGHRQAGMEGTLTVTSG